MWNSYLELAERREPTYVDVKRDVADRLKNACAGWAPEEFEAIVEKITATTLKYPPERPLRAV
jgi:hypothetical protein